jgi:hypothetical protein
LIDEYEFVVQPRLAGHELRDQIARHKSELLAALAPVTEYVYLKGGLSVSLPALVLALDLETRGFRMSLDHDQQFQVEPPTRLTECDRAAIARWRGDGAWAPSWPTRRRRWAELERGERGKGGEL